MQSVGCILDNLFGGVTTLGGLMWIKKNKFELVNLIGSVSSIVGFAILILSIISADSALPPEVIAWQYAFFVMSVFGIAATVIFTFFWVSEGLLSQRRVSTNVLVASLKILFGFLVVGVGFDALVSAIHWRWMLRVPLKLLWSYVQNS